MMVGIRCQQEKQQQQRRKHGRIRTPNEFSCPSVLMMVIVENGAYSSHHLDGRNDTEFKLLNFQMISF